jgi:hypothetical protein
VTAPFLRSATKRLQEAADELRLSAEQGRKIVDTHKNFDENDEKQAGEGREVIQSEPKRVGTTLTLHQRKRVKN